MRNWMMAILPLALVTGCNGTAPKDEQQAERNGPPASVGPITTQSFDLTGFTGVEVTGPDDVTVRRGDSFSIVARGRQDVLDRLEIKVDGSQLSIGRKRDGSYLSLRDDDLDIAITMPRLDKLRLTGSGSIDADSVDGDAIEAAVTGSGDLKIAKLTGKSAEIEVSGSGDIEIGGGSIESGDISVTGSGDVDAEALVARDLDVSITGSGNVDTQATGKAGIRILGSGNATLTGGAACTTRAMGSGTATCN